MPPAAGMWLANEAFILWCVLMRPRQLGPMQAGAGASGRGRRSRAPGGRPSSPTSLKPAVMTTTALAPCLERADDGALDGRGGHGDDAQVDGLAVLLQAGVELLAEQFAAGRVDGDDIALESPLDEVGHDGVADFSRRAGCPHHRDRLWIEQRLKHRNTTSSRRWSLTSGPRDPSRLERIVASGSTQPTGSAYNVRCILLLAGWPGIAVQSAGRVARMVGACHRGYNGPSDGSWPEVDRWARGRCPCETR